MELNYELLSHVQSFLKGFQLEHLAGMPYRKKTELGKKHVLYVTFKAQNFTLPNVSNSFQIS